MPAITQFASELIWKNKPDTETLPLGIAAVDELIAGCPRGRISEITGTASSGRTTLLHRILAAAGDRGEFTAVVDTNDAFDPVTAASAGGELESLAWVRCNGHIEHAFKAADLLLSAGGFGVVALDLCDVPRRHTQRIPLSYWFRFQRAVEKSQTIFLLLNQEPMAKSTAALAVQVEREQARFAGQSPFELLRGAGFRISARRPLRQQAASFAAAAL